MRSPGSSLISSRGVKWCWKSTIIGVLFGLRLLLRAASRAGDISRVGDIKPTAAAVASARGDSRPRRQPPAATAARGAGGGSAGGGQRLREIGDQIVGILQAHRKPQQVGRAGRARALDRGAMLDQAFDAA